MRNERDYGRTTITVPRELKQRMKRAQGYVNWSAVACDAFEKKLEEIHPIEDITSVEAALARMKAFATEASKTSENSDGYEAGQKWAMNRATPSQLSCLEEFRGEFSPAQWQRRLKTPEGIHELTDCIAASEWRDENHPRQHGHQHRRPRNEFRMGGQGEGRRFWRSILDTRPDHPGFFLDFAEGALDVWKQIKDQL